MSEVHDIQENIRLLGYGESDSSGKWIKFEILDGEDGKDALEKYRGLKGQLFDLVIDPSENQEVREENLQTKKTKGPYSEYAKKLKLSSFFRTPQVWAAIGTDDEFRAWIQRQKSCIIGNYSEFVDGEGRCEAAHVRRSSESGTGYKAEYACVPLTHEEHQIQHNQGELACLRTIGGGQWLDDPEQKAKEWFDKKRIEYVSQWAWESYKAKSGASSMADISPEQHRENAQSLGGGITALLP